MDIRELRKSVALSQYKMSRLLGVTDSCLSEWELGKKNIPLHMEKKLIEIINKYKSNPAKLAKLLKKKGIKSHHGISTKRKTPPRLTKPVRNGIRERNYNSNIKAIDLFSGCGGLTMGLHLAGIDVIGHAELVPNFEEVYKFNFPWSINLGSDIREIHEENLRGKLDLDSIDVVVGGPPCQGFSLAGWRNPSDERNVLFREFVRIINIIKPKIIIMENVGLLSSLRNGDEELYMDIISEALGDGYRISVNTLDAANFGVPQHRNRIFFVGTRTNLDIHFEYPKPTHSNNNGLNNLITLRNTIGNLEPLESGEWGQHPLHWAVDHPAHVIKWLKATPEGKSAHENRDPSLRPNSGYNTTYKRLVYNKPCATITTAFGMISSSRTVHPKYTRSLTVLEAALLQSFPSDFQFFGTWGAIRKMIGNAVPPLLGKALGEEIIATIKS
jgi:DNA (cytosine-5)-methyltransferase 1